MGAHDAPEYATPRTVTKQGLTDHLVDTMGLTGKESKRLVESFFNTMRATLAAGEEVKLHGFGNFTLHDKRARPGRNPQTGEVVPNSGKAGGDVPGKPEGQGGVSCWSC